MSERVMPMSASSRSVSWESSRLLRHQHGACRFGALGREVLAPGDEIHVKGFADPCDGAPDVTKAEQAEHLTAEIVADETLPSARAHRGILIDEMTRPI